MTLCLYEYASILNSCQGIPARPVLGPEFLKTLRKKAKLDTLQKRRIPVFRICIRRERRDPANCSLPETVLRQGLCDGRTKRASSFVHEHLDLPLTSGIRPTR